MKEKERDDEIIGKRVRIKDCEAREHGDNEGCVCHLIGHVVEIKKRYDTPFVGTPSYHIKGMNYRVRRSEVTLLKDQSTPLTAQVSKFRRAVKAIRNKIRRTGGDPNVAVAGEIDGRMVLDDPTAVAVAQAIEKHNCKNTLELNAERVAYFKQRLADRGLSASDAVIVVLNVDDPHGGPLADALMPGHNWQEHRDRGEIPIARGLAGRAGIEDALGNFDKAAADKLKNMADVAVVVVDHGVAEIFAA